MKRLKSKEMKMLRLFANSLDEEGGALKSAINDLLTEMEESEDTFTKDEVVESVKELLEASQVSKEELEEKLEELEEELEVEIENKLRKHLENGMGGKKKSDYLNSPQAVKDFANTIRNAKTGKEQKELWRKKLIENGSGDPVYGIDSLPYPVAVHTEIMTNWESNTGLIGSIRKISNKAIKIPYTEQDKENVKVRAKGHVKKNVKVAQELEVESKQILLKAIYKDLPLDRIDLVNIEDDTALINWVVEELLFMLTYELERAILIGDGRAAGVDKIATTDVEAIVKSTADAWTSIVETDTTLIEDVKTMVDTIVSKGKDIWLYLPKNILSALQKQKLGFGGTVQFVPLQNLKDQLGVAEIKTFDFDSAKSNNKAVYAIALVPDLYFRVGGEPFGEQWTIYERNQEAFRSEIFFGGQIAGLASTAILRKGTNNPTNIPGDESGEISGGEITGLELSVTNLTIETENITITAEGDVTVNEAGGEAGGGGGGE